MRVIRVLLLATLAGTTTVMSPGLADAGTYTETTTEKFIESFSDSSLCETQMYDLTISGHSMTHLTASRNEQGDLGPPFRFTEVVHAKIVALPSDGTGTNYSGHFRSADLETVRIVKNGDSAETDTDHNMVVLKGSDGSQVRLREHHHFTVNANGDISVKFDNFSEHC